MVVGYVGPERLEGGRAVRVNGLEHRHPAGLELCVDEREQLVELVGRQVLDHLRGEEPGDAVTRHPPQVCRRVGQLDVVALLPTPIAHRSVPAYAASPYPAFAQGVE